MCTFLYTGTGICDTFRGSRCCSTVPGTGIPYSFSALHYLVPGTPSNWSDKLYQICINFADSHRYLQFLMTLLSGTYLSHFLGLQLPPSFSYKLMAIQTKSACESFTFINIKYVNTGHIQKTLWLGAIVQWLIAVLDSDEHWPKMSRIALSMWLNIVSDSAQLSSVNRYLESMHSSLT